MVHVLASMVFLVNVVGYSKPILVLGNPAQNSIKAKLHFHGFTQNQKTGAPYHPDYDFSWADETKNPELKDIQKFVQAYDLQNGVTKNSGNLVIVPLARGHCDQYPELADNTHFDEVMAKVLEALGIHEDQFSITSASAHSGGGSILGKLLGKVDQSRFLSHVSQVKFYDAIYSTETVERLKAWISVDIFERDLILFSIPQLEPSKHATNLLKTLDGVEEIRDLNFKGISLNTTKETLKNGHHIELVMEPVSQKLDHWSLVRELWTYE